MAEDDIRRLEHSARSAMIGTYDGYDAPATLAARLARILAALAAWLRR